MYKIGFIGSGNMAYAIAKGIVRNNLLPASGILMNDINADRLESLAGEGFAIAQTSTELVSNCAYVVLSVKPQHFAGLFETIKGAVNKDTVFISIAAGITAQAIKENLGYDAKVILVMPNTPVLIGCGTTAMSRVAPTTPEEFSFIKEIFAATGHVEEIPAHMMNEVIPLNGSSPAFIYRFAEIFVHEATEMGFDADTANKLFCHALIGAANMMLETGKTHKELIKDVSSPGGTTLKGLEALEKCGFESAVQHAIHDCIERAYELGKK